MFGPHRLFPYAPDRTFTPTDAPKEDLFRLHAFLGFERGVFVQSTCHGSDHAALVDLLAAGKGRYRGVALLGPSTPKAEIERLDAAGVRGARLHFYFPHGGAPMPRDDMRKVIAMVAPDGWHIAFHVGGRGILEYYDFIVSIDAAVVIDHMARIDVGAGLHGEAFRRFAVCSTAAMLGQALRHRPHHHARYPAPTLYRLRGLSPRTRPSAWSGAPIGRIRITRPFPMTASLSI